jgi:putative ABC transport system ATP-binding protein
VAVALVTHDHEIADRARRRIRIRDGLIESDDGAPVGAGA